MKETQFFEKQAFFLLLLISTSLTVWGTVLLLRHVSALPKGKDPAGKGKMLPGHVVSHSVSLKSDCPTELSRRGKGVVVFLPPQGRT